MVRKISLIIYCFLILKVQAVEINQIDKGDAYYLHYGGSFRKVYIVKIDHENTTVKVRFLDDTVAWYDANSLWTKSEKDERLRLIAEEKAKDKEYCCCKLSGTDFWDITLYDRKWIKTQTCEDGFSTYNDFRGGIDYTGYCTTYGREDDEC